MKRRYIYADRQTLAQHDSDEGEEEDFKYFNLHDRLASVRLVISNSLLRTLPMCQSPALSTNTSARVCMTC